MESRMSNKKKLGSTLGQPTRVPLKHHKKRIKKMDDKFNMTYTSPPPPLMMDVSFIQPKCNDKSITAQLGQFIESYLQSPKNKTQMEWKERVYEPRTCKKKPQKSIKQNENKNDNRSKPQAPFSERKPKIWRNC